LRKFVNINQVVRKHAISRQHGVDYAYNTLAIVFVEILCVPHLGRYRWQAGAVIVADRGYGYRRSVALAMRQQAAVVVRIHPATFPLETDAAQPFPVLRWLRQRGSPEREWTGWCRWQGHRYRVRLLAAKLDAKATQAARRRQRRKAQKAGRTLTAPTLAVAGGLLLITTRDAATWSAADVLYVYRARWQVELVLKKM
jgi:hypothetical protein